MTRWAPGEANLEQLLKDGALQTVSGGQANGEQLLARAQRTVVSAAELLESDPISAYVLAYDAARHAGSALLAHQGLRPTSKGGHIALQHALQAQFDTGFNMFGTMRRRRNELEYPSVADEEADRDEALEAIESARQMISDAERLLPHLGLFR